MCVRVAPQAVTVTISVLQETEEEHVSSSCLTSRYSPKGIREGKVDTSIDVVESTLSFLKQTGLLDQAHVSYPRDNVLKALASCSVLPCCPHKSCYNDMGMSTGKRRMTWIHSLKNPGK